MAGGHVVLLSHTAQLGGAEIAALRLLQAVGPPWRVTVVLFAHGELEAELAARGIAVDVVELAARTAERPRTGLTDPRALLRSARDSLGFTGALTQRLRALDADLVVANSLKAAVLGSVAARRARLPWVWHLHDRLSRDYLPVPVVGGLRALARIAAHVVANSQQTAQLTTLPRHRVSVAYPGVPESLFTTHHQPAAPPVFGLLGRISSTKGQREFIYAAARVARAHPTAQFSIVGEALFNDQAYADQVRALPEQLGIGDRVQFPGWADDPTAALDQFTALVHASPVPEPFGQVIVEAMARRVPVIATAAGGVAEILTGAAATPVIPAGTPIRTATGQLVAPDDIQGLTTAMTWVLDNPQRAAELAEHAATEAQRRFSIATTAEICTAVWSQAHTP